MNQDTFSLGRRLSLLEEQPGSPQPAKSNLQGTPPAVHPSVPAFRRTRAETFSSFPSKLLPDDHVLSIAPIGSSQGRVRSGSLSLPANDLASAFGPSLFSNNWQPTTSPNLPSSGFAGVDMEAGGSSSSGGVPISSGSTATGSGAGAAASGATASPGLFPSSSRPSNLVSHAALSESMTITEEGAALARTLDYLGLDDNDAGVSLLPRRTSSAAPSSSPAPAGGVSSLHVSQFLRSHTSPRLQGLDLLNSASLLKNTPASLLPFSHLQQSQHHAMGHSRSRSYSVTVGDHFSMNPVTSNPVMVYRPRSSSIAHVESLNNVDSFQIPPSLGTAQQVARMESPDRNAELSPHDRQPPNLPNFSDFSPADISAPPSVTSNTYTSSTNTNTNATMSPSRSLWIGNIDPNLSPADLLASFSPFGPIESLRILPERECAFVNYVRTEDAILARDGLQGTRIGSGAGAGAGAGGIRIGFGKVEAIGDTQGMQPTKRIGNIPPTTDPAELENIFAAFGSVESARVLTHKNCGFVNFDRLEDAMEARKTMNGKEIGGSVVKIGYAKVPGKGAPNDGYSVQFGTSGLPVPGDLEAAGESLENGGSAGGEGDIYAAALPPLPDPLPNRKIDPARLREMRKRLEGHVQPKEVEAMFNEVIGEVVDLCTDYIGNVVVQKILEKSSDAQRLLLIEQVAPHMAIIGVHKNGTWVVQKMIDISKTPAQITTIVNSLKKYTPPLLLDQFGNYVVQCCLRLGSQRNQFIFDAIHDKCVEVGLGRFGARAVRTCLESQYTTKRQQKHVATAIVQNASVLVTNPNGAILVTWLLDSSSLPGRYRCLVPKLVPFLAAFCNHKLASSTVLKMVNQRIELDARDIVMKELFYSSDSTLQQVLQDLSHGVSVVQKILSTACLTTEERVRLADRVRSVLSRMPEVQEHPLSFKRLLDELGSVPSLAPVDVGAGSHDIVSPLTPHAGFFQGNTLPGMGGYFTGPGGHPTPNQSPQPLGITGSFIPYGGYVQSYQGIPPVWGMPPPPPGTHFVTQQQMPYGGYMMPGQFDQGLDGQPGMS
ncbi:hypothetical protein HDU97_002359 [Phlyctochytrium planicorne]|nr:hypothetical protein HDU97_002359 [Phlyctochytrium planicorne]